MRSTRAIITLAKEVVSSELAAGEVVILSLKNGFYYGLNPVGSFVWTLLQEPRSVADLMVAIMDHYEVSEGRCRADLETLLEDMANQGLVHITHETAD